MKRFYLQRNADASGVSGCGKVAEGCQFDTGWCALVWLTGKAAMSYYPDIETLDNIHGHQGMTQIVWIDDESSNFVISDNVMVNDNNKIVTNDKQINWQTALLHK
jgi:hypothetical protein